MRPGLNGPHRSLIAKEKHQITLKGILQYCNENYDVDSLCREFPDRMQMLVDNEGDRINK